jgi:hypothetical protein
VSASDGLPACLNPFSARQIRPGALAYRFPEEVTPATLLAQLRQQAWRGQIVGPHGSGKSTLLATLVPALDAAGIPTEMVTLHDGQRRLPPELQQAHRLVAGTVVIVDGYEQLSFWSRLRLDRHCRRCRLGLLVTTHRNAGLPELFRTVTDAHLARTLVEQLLGDERVRITQEEISERFVHHQGNLREVLFDLYDLYEQRRCG